MMQTTRRYVIVVSHDCDFNQGNREFFLVARLHPLSRGQKAEDKLELLRRGNDPRERTGAGRRIGINVFLIEPVPGHFDEPMIGSFELIIPVSVNFREHMLKRKIAEMEHHDREWLRGKLAIFLARPEDDISEDLKMPIPTDPALQVWQEIPAGGE